MEQRRPDDGAEEAEHRKWAALQAKATKKRKIQTCPLPCAACDVSWNESMPLRGTLTCIREHLLACIYLYTVSYTHLTLPTSDLV